MWILSQILSFSSVAAPLTDLVSPKRKFIWTKTCNEAYESLKNMLITAPILKAPDFEQPFCLQVDASGVGVGAALLQEGKDGIMHPVSYFSQKLKPHQRS